MGGMTKNERILEKGRMWRIVEVEEGKGEEGSREELRRGRKDGLKREREREKGKQGYRVRGRMRRGGEGRG